MTKHYLGISAAAEYLNISRNTMNYRLKKYHLAPDVQIDDKVRGWNKETLTAWDKTIPESRNPDYTKEPQQPHQH